MMRTIFFAFLLLYGVHAYCQISEVQFTKYYSLLNRAELSICRGHEDAAFDLYSQAYKINGPKMSSRHLYHYFIVSAALKNWDKCESILRELKKRGWDYDWYKKDIALLDAKSRKKLNELYQRLDVPVEVSSSYISQIDSLLAIDQKTNTHFRNLNFGVLSNEGKDSMCRLTRNNLTCLKKLFLKQFPSDALIGKSGPPWGRCRYEILLRHNAQMCTGHELDEVLYDAVGKGEFAPEDFDYWVLSFPKTYGGDTILRFKKRKVIVPLLPYDYVICNDSLFRFPVDPARVERLNDYRKMFLGLSAAGEFKEKLEFQFYHPQYHFVDADYIMPVGMEFPEKIKKRLIYVGKKEE